MHVAGPIALYLAAVALCAALALPLLRAAFGNGPRVPLFALALTVGYPLALVVFSLIAQAVPDYATALPASLVSLLAASWAVWRWQQRAAGTAPQATLHDRRSDGLLLAGFGAALVASGLVRSLWPAVTWDNALPWAGVEKLFNLSMIQAFTFGSGFPPENLWHAGQPIDYPVFAHALPGLVAWTWRVSSGDAAAAGVLFVFSDAFLFAFAGLAVAAWTQALLVRFGGDVRQERALIVAVVTGVGVLLATSGKAVALVFDALTGGAAVSWERLQEQAVPYTYSQYPFWTLLLGDHHAFLKVAFVQIAFFGAMALLLTARRVDPARFVLAGMLAAAVAGWHAGSVLLDLVVLVPATAGIVAVSIARRRWADAVVTIANTLASAALAAVLVLPGWLSRQQPQMRWYVVDSGLASPLGGFVLAQTGPLLFVLAGVAAAAATRSGAPWRRDSLVLAAALVVLLAAVAGRGGAAVAVACAALVLLTAPHRASEATGDRQPLVILAAAGFALWLLPEFVVGDLASRHVVEWKRWQQTMRFWLESYTLIPFFAVLAWGPDMAAALRRPAFARGAAAVCALVATAWVTVHAIAIADRAARWPDRAGLDGFEFLQRRHACDAAVASHLRSLPGRVQIGEACGTGEVMAAIPTEYSWPGRIAAYSGRPGVCGWSRHVFQFSIRTRGDAHTGPWSWVRFREYERAIVLALASAASNVPAPAAASTLRRFGVTHVVAGGKERRLFPGLSAESLAASLGGTVSFTAADGCGVVQLGGGSEAR
jgi:uncharacterized membrane protein